MDKNSSNNTTTTNWISLVVFGRDVEYFDVRESQEHNQPVNDPQEEAVPGRDNAAERYISVSIEKYTPFLTAPNSWLPTVTNRIFESILPDWYEVPASTEWLNKEAALEAIAFLTNGADLLPTEPHIYATNSGDFVAEFETDRGCMTTVVSDKETVLFAVSNLNPDKPVEYVIRKGSNRFRDELRSFTTKSNLGSHGQQVGT